MKPHRNPRSLFLLLTLAAPALTVAAHAAEDTTPPLPFHSIEGVGGGSITPTAYLVNPTPVNGKWGKPSVALTEVFLGQKNLTSIAASQTYGGRLELSIAAERLGLGTLPTDIRTATGVDIRKSNIWLYNLNARYLLLKEEKGRPAVTVGAHYKYNNDINTIDNRLAGALTGIGLDSKSGVDFTVTATKMFPKVAGHPLIATVGLRESKAATLGFVGFGNSYDLSFEGNLIYLPAAKWVVDYEIRQKSSPLGRIGTVVGGEDTMHAVNVGYILNNHSTLVAGYGRFGNIVNADANNALWLQFKNEF